MTLSEIDDYLAELDEKYLGQYCAHSEITISRENGILHIRINGERDGRLFEASRAIAPLVISDIERIGYDLLAIELAAMSDEVDGLQKQG